MTDLKLRFILSQIPNMSFFRLNLEQCEVAVKILKTFFVMMIGYFIMESQLTVTKINHKISSSTESELVFQNMNKGSEDDVKLHLSR